MLDIRCTMYEAKQAGKAIQRFSDYIFGSVYHKRLYNKPVCTVEIQDKKDQF